MNFTAAIATFVAILPAELPDKTIMACLILSSRYRPGIVFCGAALAFAAQVVLGVTVGGALSMLPHHVIEACAAAVFAIGAVLLLWDRDKDEDKHEAEDEDTGRDGQRAGYWPVIATSFGVVFLAEFGDLTQFLTISLAARYHDPIAVGVGATLALWVACAAAVTLGWRLLRVIPLRWLTRGAAVVMLVLAATSGYAAAS